jgi:aminodeoxyfutalosine deaminase
VHPENITLIRAAWVAPMDGPILADGAVAFTSGRILAVGPASKLKRDFPSVPVEEFDDSIVLPGLVNAHVHLELSDCTPWPQPDNGFARWLVGMLKRTRITPEEMAAKVHQAIPIGAAQCLRFGVTTVGDISRQCQLSRSLLREPPLRVVSFGEIQAMARRRYLLEERLEIASDDSEASPTLRIGLTPHAPYSVEPAGFQRCLETARIGKLPLATHLAESLDESLFLAEHRGPLRELWDQWLTWDDDVPKFTGGPIRFAQSLGLLDYPTLLAHVNYCDDAELKILAAGRASVVYCPRTHAYFRHPPHRWEDFLAAGINVAIGTDSCASSPDLNLVDDLRLLHRISPQVPAYDLWQLATTRAARAIGMGSEVGCLTPGKRADLVIFAATGPDPLAAILESQAIPRRVYFDGEPVTAAPDESPPPLWREPHSDD